MGRLTSASARNRRCRCPPERVAKGASAFPPERSAAEVLRRQMPEVERAEEIERLARGNFVLQRGGLQLGADEQFRLYGLRPEVQSVDPNRTCVGHPQSEDTFESGGFARAVRADQGEDLACRHFETDLAHRLTGALPFAQAGHGDRRGEALRLARQAGCSRP